MDRIFDTYLQAGAPSRSSRSASCRRPCRPSRSRISPRGSRRSERPLLASAGPIRRRITTSGANWCTSGCGTRVEKYGKRRSGVLVLGSLERAGHLLLARHSGRVRQALRLCRGGGEARAAHGQSRRTRPPPARATPKAAAFLRQFLEHCDGKTGAPLDFITYHAKGRRAVVDGHVHMGICEERGRCRQGISDRAAVPEVPQSAHRAQRIRSGRLRGLLGARLSAERVPQRHAVSCLHGRRDEEHLRTGRPARRPTSQAC